MAAIREKTCLQMCLSAADWNKSSEAGPGALPGASTALQVWSQSLGDAVRGVRRFGARTYRREEAQHSAGLIFVCKASLTRRAAGEPR